MGGRILIIEDNTENMDLMSYLLRAFGHEVDCVFDGETGLLRAGQRPPDLIVCDLQLPGIDGFEVARRLRDLPGTGDVPIVAVTAFAMVGDRERILAGGFDGYLSKPIEPALFVRQVEEYLEADRRGGLPVLPVPESAPVRREGGRPDASPVTGRGSDVLCIDDRETNGALVRAILEPHGIALRTTTGVRPALAAMRAKAPALVLCDVHLAGESGFDLLKAVRGDSALRPLPFMFLTATGRDPRDREAALRQGADGYIVLPVEPAFLIAEVRRWLPRGGP